MDSSFVVTLLLVLATVVITVGVGMLANWVERPLWMTKSRLAWTLAILVFIAALVQVTPSLTNTTSGPPPASDQLDKGASRRSSLLDVTPRLVSNTQDAVIEDYGSLKRITFRPLTWAGLFFDIPHDVKDYRIEFDARLAVVSSNVEAAGWGYGVGVCNRWQADEPSGFIVQYALYEENGEARDNSGRFAMPNVNEGLRVPIVVDDKVHHWSVVLKDGVFTASIDFTAPIGPYPVTRQINGPKAEQLLPENCDGAGAFLRVLGTTAEFSNMRVYDLTR